MKVQNLKCSGCGNTIEKKLCGIKGISNVEINVEDSTVDFQADSEETRQNANVALSKLGYPAEGEDNDLGKKAISYVSCMKGKLDKS